MQSRLYNNFFNFINVIKECVPKGTIPGIDSFLEERMNELIPLFFKGIGMWINSLFLGIGTYNYYINLYILRLMIMIIIDNVWIIIR